MRAHLKLVESGQSRRFEFDYNRNVVHYQSSQIRLSPHEADILHLLLLNRPRVVPLSVLIEQVYGATEPETAPVSIRVAVHSLRKKLTETGIRIRAIARVGYEIDVDSIPEMSLGLKNKILSALNVAKAAGESDIAERLQAVLQIVEARPAEAAR